MASRFLSLNRKRYVLSRVDTNHVGDSPDLRELVLLYLEGMQKAGPGEDDKASSVNSGGMRRTASHISVSKNVPF